MIDHDCRGIREIARKDHKLDVAIADNVVRNETGKVVGRPGHQ